MVDETNRREPSGADVQSDPVNADKPTDPVDATIASGQVEAGTDATAMVDDALLAFNRELDAEVKEKLALRRREAGERMLPGMDEYTFARAEKEIGEVLLAHNFDRGMLRIGRPPSSLKGAGHVDLCFNTGQMARKADQDPTEVAELLVDGISQLDFVSGVNVVPMKGGANVNISLDFSNFAPNVMADVSALGDRYGHFNEGNCDTVLFDYSSPNIAKNMTVAHLRSTIIGESLAKIHAAAGYTSFRVNHLGDTGTTFGKVIYMFRKEMAERKEEFEAELKEDASGALMRIYRQFEEDHKTDDQAQAEVRELSLRLEKGDPEMVEIWKKTRDWSLEAFREVYEMLGIEFDAMQGESFYQDRMNPAIVAALDAGVLQVAEGGAIVFRGQELTVPETGKTEKSIMRKKKKKKSPEEDGPQDEWRDEIVVKPNGGTVYMTRDIAGLQYRCRELGADQVLYVIGKEQRPHCTMLMNIAAQMGYNQIGDSQHVSFGHLNIKGRKMSSRHGEVVLLKDILDDAVEAARELIRKRKVEGMDSEPEGVVELTAEEEETAQKVGIGTVIFNDLRQDRTRDIEFNPDAAGSIEAGGCPYIQYTYCRLGSILEKAGAEDEPSGDFTVPENLEKVERDMVVALSLFPSTVADAVDAKAPHKIANGLDQFSRTLNSFYTTCDVNKADEPQRSFRIELVKRCRQVLKNSAELLHVQMPDKM